MKAMILKEVGPLSRDSAPLQPVEIPNPVPDDHQILIQVSVCGVCHTELDEIEGRTPPPVLPVVPGHQVVGTVVELGRNVSCHKIGDRVGVGWIFCSDGTAAENLSPYFQATGRDANGGYAELMKIGEHYAYAIPPEFSDEQAAPLLCAGSIGFRSLSLANLVNGQPLGLTGFGGSAHLVIQLAKHLYPDSSIYVFARDPEARDFAQKLGAHWSGNTSDRPPQKLDAIIDTTPVWTPVVEAMRSLSPGGRLVINAIRKQDEDKSALMDLSYHEHLWMEREIKSVANITADDISRFLTLAAEIPIKPETKIYQLENANQALLDLKFKPVRGSKVLRVR